MLSERLSLNNFSTKYLFYTFAFVGFVFFLLLELAKYEICTSLISLNAYFLLLQVTFVSISLIHIKVSKNKLNAFSLFLFGYFIFQLSYVFFTSSDKVKYLKIWGKNFVFNDAIMEQTVLVNIAVILFVYAGYLLFYSTEKNNVEGEKLINFSKSFFQIGTFLFVVSLPFTLYRFYLEIQIVMSHGYFYYYTHYTQVPFVLRISRFLFELGFVLILASMPSKKIFIRYAIIYMMVIGLFFVIGIRNRVVLSLLFLIWYYYKFYANKNPRLVYLFMSGIGMIFLLLYIQVSRGDSLEFNIMDLLFYFFKAQSVNFYILPITIDMQDSLHGMTIFSELNPMSLFVSQGKERLELIGFLGDQIAYALSPVNFLDGQGLGSSFNAEMYQSGILILLFFSVFLGYFIGFIDSESKRNRIYLMLSFYLITNFIYIARSGYFRNFYMIIFAIIVFILLKILLARFGK